MVSHRHPVAGLPALVVEDSPAAVDVALLDERVAATAIAATGSAVEQESGIFARSDDGRVPAGISGIVWRVLRVAGDVGRGVAAPSWASRAFRG